MKLFAVFHLNLMFSSIAEADRKKVIERCYNPLLQLIEAHNFPLGIEASGITLEIINELSPQWITRFKKLLMAGKTEFIGSGYGQIIGPLVPPSVNQANLRIGHRISEKILGLRPEIALVNEQAWSAGLVRHYKKAGYKAVFMDYDNPARFARWSEHVQHHPQLAAGADGDSIPVIWSRSMVFQKLQRYAHAEIELDEYLDYIESLNPHEGWLPVYGNDAEIFDFRPGRYKTETEFSAESEWDKILKALSALRDRGYTFHRPNEVLCGLSHRYAGNKLELCCAEQPVPVKKQQKYNLTRWAVSGREDFKINSLCRAVAAKLEQCELADEKKWRELCFCLSSDFRTHITPERFMKLKARLNSLATSCNAEIKQPEVMIIGEPVALSGRILELSTPATTVSLNTCKGLAIHRAGFKSHKMLPLFGTQEHGYFENIDLGADFFSGHLIMEGPGLPKETDLYRIRPLIHETAESILVSCEMEINQGHLEKNIRIFKDKEQIDILHRFRLNTLPAGYLRLGHTTLLTQNMDSDSLYYSSASGGTREIFQLAGRSFDHGRNVSFLVSSAHAAGLTDSCLIMGDGNRALQISPLATEHAFIAMITCKQARPTPFVRVSFSMQEMDETSKLGICGNNQFIFSTGFSVKPI